MKRIITTFSMASFVFPHVEHHLRRVLTECKIDFTFTEKGTMQELVLNLDNPTDQEIFDIGMLVMQTILIYK